MTQQSKLENVDELLELFGPAPILSSESLEAYQEMLHRLLEEFRPRNVVEQMFVKELTDCTWEMVRYTRHKMLLMQRRLVQRLEYQKQRLADALPHEEGDYKRVLESNEEPPTCPDDLLDQVIDEIDAILLPSDREERNHFRTLEVAFLYYEHIDRLHASATARRNNILNRIERYKDKLHLRRVCNQIIQDTIATAKTQTGVEPESHEIIDNACGRSSRGET
jgi:hypothetical protein